MPTLLHVDSSPLFAASISRQLSKHFVEQWQAAHPGSPVITRDLTNTTIPPIDAAWVAASFTPDAALTPDQKQALALSDSLVAELQAADEYVFGIPVHNFSVPSTFKLWIDQVARRGRTFTYATGIPEGLLKGKKATFLIASGGVYDEGTAFASMNFTEPYLRGLFRFLGVTETTFVNAGGAKAVAMGEIDRPTFLQPHLDSITKSLQPAHA